MSRFLYITVTKWESALNEKRFVLLAVAEFTVYVWLVIASRGGVRVCGRVSSPYAHQEAKKKKKETEKGPGLQHLLQVQQNFLDILIATWFQEFKLIARNH